MASFVTIGVESLEDSIEFYQEVMDFKLDNKIQPGPGLEIAFVSNDEGMKIELLCQKDMTIESCISPLTLVFHIEELESKRTLLKDKNISFEDISFPSGLKALRFKDPSGIACSFMCGL